MDSAAPVARPPLQLGLLAPVRAPDPSERGIFIHEADAAQLPRLIRQHEIPRGRAIVLADPPWDYVQKHGASRASNHYRTISMGDIVNHLEALHPHANRLCMWGTWPTLFQFIEAVLRIRSKNEDLRGRWWKWGRPVTGGSWGKSEVRTGSEPDEPEIMEGGHYGQGHHWAGCDEPVVQFTHPKRHPVVHKDVKLRNLCLQPPDEHSRKPVYWQRMWIRRYTNPEDWIIVPYGGLGGEAEAAMLEGRRCVVTEIDPERIAQCKTLLAQARG